MINEIVSDALDELPAGIRCYSIEIDIMRISSGISVHFPDRVLAPMELALVNAHLNAFGAARPGSELILI